MPKRKIGRQQDVALYAAFSHSTLDILRLIYKDFGDIERIPEQKINTAIKKTLRRSVDFLQLFSLKEAQELIHIEFQSTDTEEFPLRNFIYLGLLKYEYRAYQLTQLVVYTGKEKPKHILPPIQIGRCSYEYDVIHLPNFSLATFQNTQNIVAYSLAASTVKNKKDLDKFTKKFVSLTEQADIEATRIAFAAAESLLEHEFIEMFIEMIRKSELPKSSILEKLEKDFFQEGIKKGKEEGKKEGKKEGREEGKKEGERLKAIQTAKNCLLEGLEIERTAKITGLSIEEVQCIAQRLGSNA